MRRILVILLVALFYCAIPAKADTNACPYTPVDDDEYLFSLYERAPKKDDTGYFGYKDELAAKRLGMSLKKYTVGGVSPKFRTDFARAARFMELWGLDPTINSAYRDNYRQAMIRGGGASAPGKSFHGGTRVGGWEHGLAMDVVSAKATANSEKERLAASRPIWNWIDKYGEAFGIGRAYGNGDPPHVTPTWSPEYTAHRGGSHHKQVRVAHK